jgi:DNA-binding transcriptional MocR family regulator
VLSEESIALPAMMYGPDHGDTRLRKALASWLSDFYGLEQPIHAARITITGGASQNLGCVLQTFTDPVYTRNVWIVSPAYMLVFRILDDAGLHHKLRAIPEDDEGIDIEYLRRELDKSEQKARAEGNNHPVSAAIRLCRVQIARSKTLGRLPIRFHHQSQIRHAMTRS